MRAFLFDLDDTLFDHRHSTRQGLRVIRTVLPALGTLTLDDLEDLHASLLEQVHQDVLRGTMTVDQARIERLRRLVHGQGAHAERTAIDAAAAAYRAAYLAARRPIPGAVGLLEALRQRGPIAVVTNNLTTEQAAKVDVCGLRAHIDALVCSEAAGVAKPDPGIFEVALETVGGIADEAVMTGDSWHADVLGARAAGIRAAWFNPQRRPCPDPGAVLELHRWEPIEVTVERLLAL
jgi:HAD superfamily hydrolase (TIGR01509 family)